MRELNENELEQVAGGLSISLGAGSAAAGGATAAYGVAGSESYNQTKLTSYGAVSTSANKSGAAGWDVAAGSQAVGFAGLNVQA